MSAPHEHSGIRCCPDVRPTDFLSLFSYDGKIDCGQELFRTGGGGRMFEHEKRYSRRTNENRIGWLTSLTRYSKKSKLKNCQEKKAERETINFCAKEIKRFLMLRVLFLFSSNSNSNPPTSSHVKRDITLRPWLPYS